MPKHINNKILKERFKKAVIIHSTDQRGFYIAGYSCYYLYNDGVIRDKANASCDASAFWPTRKEAEIFWDEWKEDE
jgi:hypothetical protein